MPAAAIRREKGAIVSEVVHGRYAGLRRGASRGGGRNISEQRQLKQPTSGRLAVGLYSSIISATNGAKSNQTDKTVVAAEDARTKVLLSLFHRWT